MKLKFTISYLSESLSKLKIKAKFAQIEQIISNYKFIALSKKNTKSLKFDRILNLLHCQKKRKFAQN